MIHKTRFTNLGYMRQGDDGWQFFDLSSAPAQIGPLYPTKAELLADLARFAHERGYDHD